MITQSLKPVGLCHKSQLSDDPIEDVKVVAEKEVKKKPVVRRGGKRKRAMKKDTDSKDGKKPNPTAKKLRATKSHEEPEYFEEKCNLEIPPVLEVDLDDIEELDFDNNQNQEKLQKADKNEKSKRREKQTYKEERERKIQAAEGRLLKNHAPESVDDFEKLVRGSPNSSFVWIKYMAFMLSLADIEKARSIAERALRTINMREEQEKLNIWVAYFNLENKHGSPPEEAVKKVFVRARQYCDPKKVYLALLGVYERTDQYKLADKLLDEMIKKFKKSRKIWLRKVQSSLKQNEQGIQFVVDRALQCLPEHKKNKFISQTAILEFKCGVADRGRSRFEGVLRNNPTKTDLWSVYLDQEIRLGEVDVIRSLFERAISLSLHPKQMKFLFKKYLEYEKSFGDEERVEYVKQKAMEYAESTLV